MRLIDADALLKSMFSYYACVNENTCKRNYNGETIMTYEVAELIEDCIENAPTIDAVPVVRCKDCKNYNTIGCSKGFGWCESMDRGVSDDFYCANGAKMDGGLTMAKYKSITEMAEEIRDEALDNIEYNGITLRELCDKLKSNEYAPVVRGRWRTWEEQFPDRTTRKKNNLGVFCSACQLHADNMTSYCPNCGAKMEVEHE